MWSFWSSDLRRAKRTLKAKDYLESIRWLQRAFDDTPDFQRAEAIRYTTSVSKVDRSYFWRPPQELFADTPDLKSKFETIYARGVWGNGSGGGSDLQNSVLYIAYVQHLIHRFSVRSIVDVGCGDWRFSRFLDLNGCRYHGVDIVSSVIDNNQKQYGSSDVTFAVADATNFEIPECDLLLCKDVLQHLSNKNVQAILEKSRAAQIALFTNDYHPVNEDCSDGSTRPLDISASPFNFKATPRLAFQGKVTFIIGDFSHDEAFN